MQGWRGVHGIPPRAHVHLEVQVRTGGLRITRITDVSYYLASSYAYAVLHPRRVREPRISEIVLRSRVVVVQMVIEVLIAVVAAQQHRIALSILRPHRRNPVDGTIHYLSLIHISEPTRRTPISY